LKSTETVLVAFSIPAVNTNFSNFGSLKSTETFS